MWKKGGVWSQSDTCADNIQVGVGQASVMYAISRPLPPPHWTRSVMTVSNGLCLSKATDQTCIALSWRLFVSSFVLNHAMPAIQF